MKWVRIFPVVMILLLLLGMTACGCKHEWEAATCTTPETCKLCQTTRGQRLGHSWTNASCTQNKACSRCGTIAELAQGHSWVEATTEAPKTCRICGATEGDRIITDPRFTSAQAAPFVGIWEGEMRVNCQQQGYTGVKEDMVYTVHLELDKAGNMYCRITIASGLSIKAEVIRLMAQTMFGEFAEMGLDEAAADAQMQSLLGMTVYQYATYQVQDFTFIDLSSERNGVYFVQDGKAYAAANWSEDMSVYNGVQQKEAMFWRDPLSGQIATLYRAESERKSA